MEDLVEHHVLMRALDIQLRIFQKEVMQEQWVLAEYFFIHQDGVEFVRHIKDTATRECLRWGSMETEFEEMECDGVSISILAQRGLRVGWGSETQKKSA